MPCESCRAGRLVSAVATAYQQEAVVERLYGILNGVLVQVNRNRAVAVAEVTRRLVAR